MQFDEFHVQAGYVIVCGGMELDIHNNYDLVSVDHDPPTASARNSLQRTRGDWVDESQPMSITLGFENVSRFITKPGDPSLAEDRQTICFIGFLFPDDATMDGYLDNLSDPAQDLIVGMEDESAVKIHADRVAITVDA